MPFNGKSGKFNAAIRTVEIGTGDKAVKLGGENVLPFYTFDAPIENAPKIGVLISDSALDEMENEVAGIKDYYAGAASFAELAKKAEAMPGADFVVLHFDGADPNGANKSVEECVAIAKEVA
ncbi:MAG: acetyl-CoA synthase subunit delta, partial [Candidatus Limivivens sp.]|nr:acetyl-CoA synthase subunit delta [Candidatus Limivivens sp.]